MGKRIHKLSFYALIVAVYAIFFSVESFYNFEGHSEAREIIKYSSFVQCASVIPGVKAAVLSHPAPHRIRMRLNKRFHQEDFSPCQVYEVSAPVMDLTPGETGTFPIALLPSVSPVHPQLRGPPSVV